VKPGPISSFSAVLLKRSGQNHCPSTPQAPAALPCRFNHLLCMNFSD